MSIVNWIIDFLSDRYQRVKLSEGCLSEWGVVPSGVPQGTKLGPWLFIIVINDLTVHGAKLWKYVDDTTVSEVVEKGQVSSAQQLVNSVVNWSICNRFQINSDKCKELRISFAKNRAVLPALEVDGQALKVVDSTKLLGLTISSDLTWNAHVLDVVKKAAKRLYFLKQLKRANVPKDDLVRFYCACIRSVLDYAIQVFHSSLPEYLVNDLERVQKRAISIICPNLSYSDALLSLNLDSLEIHHEQLCHSLFRSIEENNTHRLHRLLPPVNKSKYSLRNAKKYKVKLKTNRAQNSFFNSHCRK